MIRRSKITNQEIIQDFINTHGNLYIYDEVVYKTMHTKVKIRCRIHGIFEQTPNAHIRLSQGCKKCKLLSLPQYKAKDLESFIEESIHIHGDKFTYSKTNYINAITKVIITCKEHGDFELTPNSHLSKRVGCPECSKLRFGWTKTAWRNSCIGKIPKLYFIFCYNDKESFFKIGITNKDSVKDRFYHKYFMPYNYTVIRVISSDNPDYIFNLERSLHKLHSKLKYKPNIWFDGYTECFKELLIDPDQI